MVWRNITEALEFHYSSFRKQYTIRIYAGLDCFSILIKSHIQTAAVKIAKLYEA